MLPVRQEEIQERGVSQKPSGHHFYKKRMMEVNESIAAAK